MAIVKYKKRHFNRKPNVVHFKFTMFAMHTHTNEHETTSEALNLTVMRN